MKRFNFYLSLMLLLVCAAACSDDFDTPPMTVPTAEHKANMTIADFKAKYWQTTVNYIDTVKDDDIIQGYVTSSDESGNIYKSLYISDGTGGLTISINQNSLYNTYRIGQKVVIPMRGYFVGKYNGQQQLGYPQYYEKGLVWEATFLPSAMWQEMVEIDGLPDLTMVDTTVVSISDFQGKTDDATLLKYQGKLVRFNNVSFADADGTITFAESGSTTNRNIVDADNNTLVVRNSNYASFRGEALPMGKGSVVGLLSFYATRANSSGTWQLYLRSIDDCIGFSTDTKGRETDPYTVEEAKDVQNLDKSGWVKAYVVGAAGPEVTTISSNSDIEWKAPTTLDNTLILADDPECTDYTKCLIVPMPQGTPFRTQANLKDNPAVYKTVIYVYGRLATYMGMDGIVDNSGSTSEFKLSVVTGGVTQFKDDFEESAIKSDWTNLQVLGDKKWYRTSFNNNGYAAMTGYKGTPPFDSWLITPALDIKNATSKTLTFRTQVNGYGSSTSVFEVYVLNSLDPSTATVMTKLNPTIATAPASGYSSWAESGTIDLSQFADGSYYIGFRYYATNDANFATWCLDDVAFGYGEGGSTGDDPTTENATRADFETLNSGTATSKYGTYTTTQGWTATNCIVLSGGTADSNPTFTFIGFVTGSTTEYAFAPTLNGKTSAVGTLVSPTLSGGISKLRFSYGAAYNESQLSFRVDIKQNGSVVKTWTVTNTSVTKAEVYSFEEEVSGVTGEYTIEITNLSPSASTSNKDRVSIWNLNWDTAE